MCIAYQKPEGEFKCFKCYSEIEVEEREIQIVCPTTNKIIKQKILLCDKCFCEYIDEAGR